MSFIWIKFADSVFSILCREVNIREWFVLDQILDQSKEWQSDGNVLLLSINEHCFAKKELKILLFSLKSDIICYNKKAVYTRNFSTI